jgi:protein SCO1/2
MVVGLSRRALLVLAAALVFTDRAAAHSLQEVEADLVSKEKYFQPADSEAPGFDLQDATGKDVKLSGFKGKVVVLHFIYTNCPDTCPLHAEKIAAIQQIINISPMKQLVQFISVTTDPKHDIGKVLTDFGENHGLDPVNWTFLTARPDQPENITRDLAKAYGVEFKFMDNGEQMHGVLTSVIDQGGRLRGRFHGMEFQNISLVLFANALVNIASEHHGTASPGLWSRFTSWLGP